MSPEEVRKGGAEGVVGAWGSYSSDFPSSGNLQDKNAF